MHNDLTPGSRTTHNIGGNSARRAMLRRRRLRWSRRAGSYLDGEQGKSKAVVLEWIPGSGTVVHVETTGSCRGDSWQEVAEEAEGVQYILSSIMIDSHFDSEENVQLPWSKVKP